MPRIKLHRGTLFSREIFIYNSREEYRKAWSDAYIQDPLIPLNLDIELASTCNLACPFCFWGESDFNMQMAKAAADGKPKKRLMPTEMAISLINQAAEIGIPALKFNWRGESTMHPDYSKILKYAAGKFRWDRPSNYNGPGGGGPGKFDILNIKEGERNIWEGCFPGNRPCFHDLLVNTNANCKDHAIDGLMAATKCMVSLDSTIPEIYAKMRVGGRLQRAIEVTKEIIRRGHPDLWIRRVITKENTHEPFAQNVHAIFGGKGYKVSEHHCVDRSADSSHQTNNPDLYERTYCGYPSQRLMVASDGACYPCCVDYDGTMPMGSIHKNTLLEIWNNEHFRKLRHNLRQNRFQSAACQKCTSWMAYKAPQKNQVQDKEVKI